MAGSVILSAAVRTNLLSLQSTTRLIDRTQSRLSTGLETSWPGDDAVAFFQAKGLSDRAADFTETKDGIDQGISTLNAAIAGAAGIESLVRQLKGLALNAKAATSETIDAIVAQFNDLRTQIDALAADTAYQGLNLINGTGSTLDVSFSKATSAMLNVASVDCTVGRDGLDVRRAGTANGGFNVSYPGNTGHTLYHSSTFTLEFAGTGTTMSAGRYAASYGTATLSFTVGSAGAFTTSFTNTESFETGQVLNFRRVTDASMAQVERANYSTTGDQLKFEFPSHPSYAIATDAALDVTWAEVTASSLSAGIFGFDFGGVFITVSVGTAGANSTTFSTTEQFYTSQGAITLSLHTMGIPTGSRTISVFGLTGGTSSQTGFVNPGRYIVSSDQVGALENAILEDAAPVEIGPVSGQYIVHPGAVDQINLLVRDLDSALNTLRSHAQSLGSNVALLQTRLDFTQGYVTLLTEGAGKLTLADLNEEGANLLALQTRQQLGIQALSFAGQAEQSILTLFN